MKGLSVAQAIHDANLKYHSGNIKKILIIAGPGSNKLTTNLYNYLLR